MSRNNIEAMVQESVHKALVSYGVASTDAQSRRKPTYTASTSKKKNKRRNPSYDLSKEKNGNASERATKRKPVSKGFRWDCFSRDPFRNSKNCSFPGGETYVDKMHLLSKEEPEKKKSSDGFFSQRPHAFEWQSNLLVRRGAKKDAPGQDDLNPIIDFGCPRNFSGIHSALRITSALRIAFKLHQLDREPFYHG